MGYLKLRIEADGDGTAELFAEFEGRGFSGHGSAWFDLLSLAEKAKEFAKFPLQPNGPACIEGGYWSKNKPDRIEQEHLHISAHPINGRGGIGVRIRAAESFDPEYQSQPNSRVSTELETSYEQMAKFSKHLRDLVNGHLTVVVLDEADA